MEAVTLDSFYPIFYGGYMSISSSYINDTIKIDILYNNESKSEIIQVPSEDPQNYSSGSLYAGVLQKQDMIYYMRVYDNIWIIDYYPLNTIDSNGTVR